MKRYRYKTKKEIKKKRGKSIFRSKVFWLGILITILVSGIFYLFFLSPVFQIKQISISGNQKIKTEEIKNNIIAKTNHRILFFNSQAFFLSDCKKIEQNVLKEFPLISEIKIKRNFFSFYNLTIEIKERISVGTWCKNTDCFQIDKQGIIFEKAAVESSLNIRSENGKEYFLGSKVIDDDYLTQIIEIQKKLKDSFNTDVAEFIISGNNKLTAKTEDGWEVYFVMDDTLPEQISNLVLVLNEKIPPENRGNLLYVDLRFNNKIYFKYKP